MIKSEGWGPLLQYQDQGSETGWASAYLFDVSTIDVTDKGDAIRFSVRVQPRASRDEIVGIHGTTLKIRLAAPPVDGAANDALVRFIAEWLGVARNAVRIVAGASSRQKIVEVDGVTCAAIDALIDTPIRERD